MKKRRINKTPIFIDLTLDEEESETPQDLNIRDNNSVKEDVSRKYDFKKENPQGNNHGNNGESSLLEFRRKLFKTISNYELAMYVGIMNERRWRSYGRNKKIKLVIKHTKKYEINAKHPLYICLIGNSEEKLRMIYREFIASSVNLSKYEIVCEMVRKFFKFETSIQKRTKESSILKDIGNLEDNYRFVIMCSITVPNEIIKYIISYLPRNLEIMINIGGSHPIFYVHLLTSWESVKVTKINIHSIPLTVLKHVNKICLGDIRMTELSYVFSHLTPSKIKEIELDGTKFRKCYKFSPIKLLRDFKISTNYKVNNPLNQDEKRKSVNIISIFNNIEKLELPGMFWDDVSGFETPAIPLTQLFPRIRSIFKYNLKLNPGVLMGTKLEEFGIICPKYFNNNFDLSGGTRQEVDVFNKMNVKRLILENVGSNSYLEKILNSFPNLENLTITPCFNKLNYQLFDSMMNLGLGKNLKKLVLIDRCLSGNEVLEINKSKIDNLLNIHLDHLEVLGEISRYSPRIYRVGINFREFSPVFVNITSHVKNLKLQFQFESNSERRMKKDRYANWGKDCDNANLFFKFLTKEKLKLLECFDLTVFCINEEKVRICYHKKKKGSCIVKISIQTSLLPFNPPSSAQNLKDEGWREDYPKYPCRMLFLLAVVNLLYSQWTKNETLDLLVCSGINNSNPKWRTFFQEMADWNFLRDGYDLDSNFFSITKKVLL